MAGSREKILAKIRTGLTDKNLKPFPESEGKDPVLNLPDPDELESVFQDEFTKLNGKYYHCKTSAELGEKLSDLSNENNWKHLFGWEKQVQDLLKDLDFRKLRIGKKIENADAGVTGCEALLARTGSILLSSGQESGRTLPIFPPVHIVIAGPDKLIPDLDQGLMLMTQKYGKNNLPSMINVASGPSRTADIEKTLVLGAHGPKEVHVFLCEELKEF